MTDERPLELLTRYSGNPILTADAFRKEYRIQYCFNSGAVKMGDSYVMMCRLENIALRPVFWVATSTDGIHFTPKPKPVQMPDDPEFSEYTAAVFYDPRITKIRDTFHLVHAAHSPHGCRLSLLETKDFDSFTWLGFINQTDNRNGVLSPEKINGMYVRFDRPNAGDFGDMWISYSSDLIHWGQSKCVLRNAEVLQWAYSKIGPGAAPIRTEEGSTSSTVSAPCANRTTCTTWVSVCKTSKTPPESSPATTAPAGRPDPECRLHLRRRCRGRWRSQGPLRRRRCGDVSGDDNRTGPARRLS